MGIINNISGDLEKEATRLFSNLHSSLMVEAEALCGDRAAAEDLVMQTIEKLCSAGCKYDEEQGGIFPYARKVLKNEYLKSIRGKMRKAVVYIDPDELAIISDERVENLQGVAASSEENAETVRAAIASLSPEMREIIMLRHFDECPIPKIARILGLSENSVRCRLHYARKVLAARLLRLRKPKALAALAAALLAVISFAAVKTGVLSFAAEDDAPAAAAEERVASQPADLDDLPAVPGDGALAQGDGLAAANAAPLAANAAVSTEQQEGQNMNTNIRKTVIAAASLAASLASAPALATTPAGYTPIAYIQGNGVDARIITDYIPHPQTDKIEAEIEWPEGKIDGNQGVWCARGDDGTDKTYTLFAIGSNLRFDYNKTRGDLLAPALAKDVKYTVTADRYEFTWSGGNGQTHTEDTGFLQAGNPLVLFATYAKGIDSEVGNYGKFRLYSFKVWRSGELIHDFVPCRDANRVATVIDICDNPATLTVEGTFFAPGALPTGYTPVTYIQGNGVDARIITDYIPNPQTDKVEAVVEWPEGKIDGNQGVWCARGTTTTDNTWTLHMLGNSGSKLRFDYKSTSGDLFEPAVSTDVKYTVTVDRYIATWSGGNGHTHTADPNFTAAGNNLVLFGVYSGATVDAYTGNYGKFRLYSFKVWQSGELIHDFVPCKDASGVATMVDICDNPATLTVEGTFFTPGDKGRLPAGYVELEYIQGGNKTRIITDYVPHPQTDKVEAVVEWPSSVSGALSGNQGVWCARGTTTTDNTWTLHMLGEQGSKLRFDYKTTSGNLFDPAVSTDVKYTVTVDRYIATWSGGNGHTHTADPNFTAAGNKLVLFGVYSGATIDTNPGNYGKHRLYSFKVWRSRKLIHYFVPCKDRNNVVTMYDICDNPAGLSVQNTFTAGPEGHYYDDSLFRHSGFVYIVR